MRRLFALVLVSILMSCSVASAEAIDLTAMSQDELIALIDNARLELSKYLPYAEKGTVLYEDENIKITLNGEITFDDYDNMLVDIIIENYSSYNLLISTDNASCNGWDINSATASVSANKKAKATLDFYDAVIDADLSSVEDVEDITCSIRYFDSDGNGFRFTSEAIVWNFGE